MASELKLPERRHQGAGVGAFPFLIRPFDRMYEAEVRDLFVQCVREIAPPPPARAEIEAYVANALAGDYRDIVASYRPGRGRGFWLALSREGDLMGTFALLPASRTVAELRRMYVGAPFRRRGVARAMLAKAEALCAGWCFQRLFLATSSLNQAAIELYRGAGFEQSDHVPTSVQGPPPPGVRIFAFEKVVP